MPTRESLFAVLARRSGDVLGEPAAERAFTEASDLAFDREAMDLAEAAEGRGPYAAAALRWAAERVALERLTAPGASVGYHTLMRWAREAER